MTTSKISFNISDTDGSQDCLFAPISTTTDPPKGRLLGVRRHLLVPVAEELAVITAMLQEEAGIHAPIHPWLGVVFLHVRGIPLSTVRGMRAATEAR